METSIVSVIVQAGAVGLAGVSLWILYKVIVEVMPQMTQEISTMSKALVGLTEVVRSLKSDIDKCK